MGYNRLTTEEAPVHEFLGHRENGQKVLLKANTDHPSGKPLVSLPPQVKKQFSYSRPIAPFFGDVSPWKAILAKKKEMRQKF